MVGFSGAPEVVEAMPRVGLPYGLFSVLTPRSLDDPHWQNDEGIEWETLTCTPASGIGSDWCEPEDEESGLAIGLPKNLDPRVGILGEATPFTVYGTYNCGPLGHTIEYGQERAAEHLLSREEARVEQAIWTGDLGNTGFAAGAENAGSFTIRRAIARLDRWLATNYGSLGVLHMTREAADVGLDYGVLEIKGNRLQTALGTPVVAGAGYPGTGPAGEAEGANTTYIYATPALMGYRSEVFPGTSTPAAGLDRETNDLHAVAERTYAVGYDPCGTAYALATLPE